MGVSGTPRILADHFPELDDVYEAGEKKDEVIVLLATEVKHFPGLLDSPRFVDMLAVMNVEQANRGARVGVGPDRTVYFNPGFPRHWSVFLVGSNCGKNASFIVLEHTNGCNS